MSKGKIDIRMGGRYRDRDEQVSGTPGGNDDLIKLIQDLINNSTINWSQIIGSPTTNTELKSYIDNLLELIALNQYEADQLITQQMLDYFNTLNAQLTDVFNQLATLTSVNAEFKTYIDNQISALETYIDQLVLGDTFTAELKQYIDDSIANLQTILTALIQSTVSNEVINYIENNLNLKGEATRLISGSVTWIENLDFLCSPLVYQILNQKAESPETLVTIPANVENNPRFAVIYADIFGNVGYILGAAAANPAVPLVDDATQIRLTTVYIAALGTTPGTDPNGGTETIVNTVIYDENIEWASAKTEEAGITINLEHNVPAHGAKNIHIAFIGAGSTVVNQGLIAAKADSSLLVAGIRRLVYYRANAEKQVTAYLKNVDLGFEVRLRTISMLKSAFAVPELGFSAPCTDQLTLSNEESAIPAGNYRLFVSGLTRYEQQYIVTETNSVTPAAALVSLTAAAPVNASGGKILLSLKTSAAWLANTALLLELWSGTTKVGALPIAAGSLHGFNPDNTFDYQRIALPVADFNPTSLSIDKLTIRPVNAWPNCDLLIDYIVLQTGTGATAERIEDITFEYRDVTEAGQVYELDPAVSFPYLVKEICVKTNTGNVSAAIKIGATAVTGLSAVAATNAIQTIKATGANVTAKNNVVTLEILEVTNEATALIGKARIIRL